MWPFHSPLTQVAAAGLLTGCLCPRVRPFRATAPRYPSCWDGSCALPPPCLQPGTGQHAGGIVQRQPEPGEPCPRPCDTSSPRPSSPCMEPVLSGRVSPRIARHSCRAAAHRPGNATCVGRTSCLPVSWAEWSGLWPCPRRLAVSCGSRHALSSPWTGLPSPLACLVTRFRVSTWPSWH